MSDKLQAAIDDLKRLHAGVGQHTGRKVIVDVEGLKETLGIVMVSTMGWEKATGYIQAIRTAIDAHTITLPDLVKREEIPIMEGCDCNEIFLTICEVPEWDGKE